MVNRMIHRYACKVQLLNNYALERGKIMKYIGIFFWAFILCFQNAYGAAQISDTLIISGFGGWAYGKTDNDNRYLAGKIL